MTSTTLSIEDFASKLQQATLRSTNLEGNPILYTDEVLRIIAGDDDNIVLPIGIHGVCKSNPYLYFYPPTLNYFNPQSARGLELLESENNAYNDLLHYAGELPYKEIYLTLRDVNGDHAGRAVVPMGFEYDQSDCIIIDGTSDTPYYYGW